MSNEQSIKLVDPTKIDEKNYSRRCIDCLILSHDKKILFQQRDLTAPTYPGCLAAFGGGVESGETSLQTLIRELKEELGAKVNPNEVVNLGIITEASTNHKQLIYAFFWHDKSNTVTGCYEGEAKYYANPDEALQHPKIMDDVVWLIKECQKRNLIKQSPKK